MLNGALPGGPSHLTAKVCFPARELCHHPADRLVELQSAAVHVKAAEVVSTSSTGRLPCCPVRTPCFVFRDPCCVTVTVTVTVTERTDPTRKYSFEIVDLEPIIGCS